MWKRTMAPGPGLAPQLAGAAVADEVSGGRVLDPAAATAPAC